MIEKRFSNQIVNEVISDTIQSNYQEAITEQKIMPAGLVSVEPTPYEDGKDFEFIATVELFPEIPSAES